MVPEISTIDLVFIKKDAKVLIDYPSSGGKCKRGESGGRWVKDLGDQRRAMLFSKGPVLTSSQCFPCGECGFRVARLSFFKRN